MVINEPGRHEQPKWAALSAPERLADAGTPQSAPEPSQTATEARGDAERRHWNVSDEALRDATVRLNARDAEVTELRAEVERLRKQESGQTRAAQSAWRNADQFRAALAVERAKVARAEELAHKWEDDADGYEGDGYRVEARVTRADARDLLAALAEPEATESCPTCSWPRRETSGLVCQTCGWDYAKGEKPVRTTEGGALSPARRDPEATQ